MAAKDRPQSVITSMAHRHYQLWTTGTAATEYAIGKTVLRVEDLTIFVDGTLRRPADATGARDYRIRGLQATTPNSSPVYPGDSNTVTFTVAPNGKSVCFMVAGG